MQVINSEQEVLTLNSTEKDLIEPKGVYVMCLKKGCVRKSSNRYRGPETQSHCMKADWGGKKVPTSMKVHVRAHEKEEAGREVEEDEEEEEEEEERNRARAKKGKQHAGVMKQRRLSDMFIAASALIQSKRKAEKERKGNK